MVNGVGIAELTYAALYKPRVFNAITKLLDKRQYKQAKKILFKIVIDKKGMM